MTKSRTIFIAMELLNVSYIMKTFEISSKLFAYRHTHTCRYTWFIRKNDSTIDNALKLLTTRRNVLTMRISSLADVMIARISIQWFENRNYWYECVVLLESVFWIEPIIQHPLQKKWLLQVTSFILGLFQFRLDIIIYNQNISIHLTMI